MARSLAAVHGASGEERDRFERPLVCPLVRGRECRPQALCCDHPPCHASHGRALRLPARTARRTPDDRGDPREPHTQPRTGHRRKALELGGAFPQYITTIDVGGRFTGRPHGDFHFVHAVVCHPPPALSLLSAAAHAARAARGNQMLVEESAARISTQHSTHHTIHTACMGAMPTPTNLGWPRRDAHGKAPSSPPLAPLRRASCSRRT